MKTALIWWTAVIGLFAGACGKSNKSSSSSSSGGNVGSSGQLAVTYPEGLAVSSSSTTAPTSTTSEPTTVTYASGSLSLPTSLTVSLSLDSYDPTQVTAKDRILEAAKRLKGEADDCLPVHLFNPKPAPPLTCYNPDGDLSKVYQTLGPPPSNPRFPLATGVTAAGEACLATYSRAKIAEVAAIVDQAQVLVEGMICSAYKNNKKTKLPKIGATLELTETLADITGAQQVDPATDITSPTGAPTPVTGAPTKAMFRFKQASIQRLENTADRARFLANIVMEVNGTVRQIRLMHMPSLTAGNNDYLGRLSIKTVRVQRDGLAENRQNYLDVNYMMDLDTTDGGKPKTRYRLLRAMFNHAALVKLGKDPFAGIGQLDLNVGANFTVASNHPDFGKFPTDVTTMSDTMSQIEQIDYEGNPITSEGKLSYWINPGGNYNEPARGLVADRKRETPESTRLIGCAVSGAALGADLTGTYSIRKAQRDKVAIKPTGYYHPNGTDVGMAANTTAPCALGDCRFAPFVYKQCYRQNDSGLYVPSGNTDTAAQFDVINIKTTPGVVNERLPVVDGKIQSP
jgi:hypothetical protein